MFKLLELIKGYDNYLDSGAISILEDKLEGLQIKSIIAIEIKIPELFKDLFKDLKPIVCKNSYSDISMDEVFEVYMGSVFSKLIKVKDGIEFGNDDDNIIQMSELLCNNVDTCHDVDCVYHPKKLKYFNSDLITYLMNYLTALFRQRVNIIGLHRFYDTKIDFNPLTDLVMLGYFNNKLLLLKSDIDFERYIRVSYGDNTSTSKSMGIKDE